MKPEHGAAAGGAAPAAIHVRFPLGVQVPSGTYTLTERTAHSLPVWQLHVSADECAVLYSGQNGKWFFGDQEDVKAGFRENAGWVASARPHGGLLPHDVAVWSVYSTRTRKYERSLQIYVGSSPPAQEEARRDPPAVLRLSLPEQYAATCPCAGSYSLLPETANGWPTWKHDAADVLIYSSRKGKWFFGDSEDRDGGFKEESGWVASRGAHQGSYPNEIRDWQVHSAARKRYVVDPDVQVLVPGQQPEPPPQPPPQPPPPAPEEEVPEAVREEAEVREVVKDVPAMRRRRGTRSRKKSPSRDASPAPVPRLDHLPVLDVYFGSTGAIAEMIRQGKYLPDGGVRVNGWPVWRCVVLDSVLFTAPSGRWMFGDGEDEAAGYPETGWVSSAQPHGNALPDEIMRWQKYDDVDQRWCTDPLISVRVSPSAHAPLTPEPREPYHVLAASSSFGFVPPERIRVTIPEYPRLSGVFKMTTTVANGYPVWKQMTAKNRGLNQTLDCLLYSGPDGKWFFGDSDDEKSGFKQPAGWAASTVAEKGSCPTSVRRWDVYDRARRRWRAEPEMRVIESIPDQKRSRRPLDGRRTTVASREESDQRTEAQGLSVTGSDVGGSEVLDAGAPATPTPSAPPPDPETPVRDAAEPLMPPPRTPPPSPTKRAREPDGAAAEEPFEKRRRGSADDASGKRRRGSDLLQPAADAGAPRKLRRVDGSPPDSDAPHVDSDGASEEVFRQWPHQWVTSPPTRLYATERVHRTRIRSGSLRHSSSAMTTGCVGVTVSEEHRLSPPPTPDDLWDLLPRDVIYYVPEKEVKSGSVPALHVGIVSGEQTDADTVAVEPCVPDTPWWRLSVNVGRAQEHLRDSLPSDQGTEERRFWDSVMGDVREAAGAGAFDLEEQLEGHRSVRLPEHLAISMLRTAAQELRLGVPWDAPELDSVSWLTQRRFVRVVVALRFVALRWRLRGGCSPSPRAPPTSPVLAPRESFDFSTISTDRPIALMISDSGGYETPDFCLDQQDRYMHAEAAVIREEDEGRVTVITVSQSSGFLAQHREAVLAELSEIAGVQTGGALTPGEYKESLLAKAWRLKFWGEDESCVVLDPERFVDIALTVTAATRWAALEVSPRTGLPVFVVARPPGHHSSAVAHWETAVQWDVGEVNGRLRAKETMLRRTGRGGCFVPSLLVAMLANVASGDARRTALVDVDVHAPDGHLGDLHGVLTYLTHRPPEGDTPLLRELRRKWASAVVVSSHLTHYPEDCTIPPVNDSLRLTTGEGTLTYRRVWATLTESWGCPCCDARFERHDCLVEHCKHTRDLRLHADRSLQRLKAEQDGEEAPRGKQRKVAMLRASTGNLPCKIDSEQGAKRLVVYADSSKEAVVMECPLDGFTAVLRESGAGPELVLSGGGDAKLAAKLTRGKAGLSIAELRRLLVHHNSHQLDQALESAYLSDIKEMKACAAVEPSKSQGVLRTSWYPHQGGPLRAAEYPSSTWNRFGADLWRRVWDRGMAEAVTAESLFVSLGLDVATEECGCSGKTLGWGFGEIEWGLLGRAVATAPAKSRVLFLEGGYHPKALLRLGTVIRSVHTAMQPGTAPIEMA